VLAVETVVQLVGTLGRGLPHGPRVGGGGGALGLDTATSHVLQGVLQAIRAAVGQLIRLAEGH